MPLARSASAPKDLFIEMVIGVATIPRPPKPLPDFSPDAFDANGVLIDANSITLRSSYDDELAQYKANRDSYETAQTSAVFAEEYFRSLHSSVSSELSAIKFLQGVFTAVAGLDIQGLSDTYNDLVRSFILRYNLRYDLRGRFDLSPTLNGVFSNMLAEAKRISAEDAHLDLLMREFEEAFGDFAADRTQAKIKSCLQKQFNLLEALGRANPAVTATTLGAMCGQLDWPHVTVRDVGIKLYGFRSDYPGLGHGGNPEGMLRELELRDFVSLSVMLASLTPYLAHTLDCGVCYDAKLV